MNTRASSFAVLVLVAAVAPVVACDPDDPFPSNAATDAAFSELFANYLEKCEGGDARKVREIRRGQVAVAPGQIYDAKTVAACARAVNAGLCDDPACALIHPFGVLEDGAPCRVGSQCKSTTCGDDTGICSTCTPNPACGNCPSGTLCTKTGCSPPPVIAKVGEACSLAAAPLAFCARGTTCDGRPGKCVADGAIGAACNTDACTTNAYCDLLAGLCAATKPAGAPCNNPFLSDCQQGLVCAAGVCKAITAVPLGEPCDDASLCEGGVCDRTTGRCKAYPKVGESCEGVRYCADGARCDGETCLTTDAYFCE